MTMLRVSTTITTTMMTTINLEAKFYLRLIATADDWIL